jgi:hypothetical protein
VIFGGLNIYPNPFAFQTTIEFPNPEGREYRLTIRDISGKVVRVLRFTGDRILIDRGDLSPGLYSVELSGKKIFRDKFIIR